MLSTVLSAPWERLSPQGVGNGISERDPKAAASIWGSSPEVLLILQPFTHKPPPGDPLEEWYQFRYSMLWTLYRLFLIWGSRCSPPGKLRNPFLVNKLADQRIQAQRKEEENGFASCLLWGSVTSRAEDSSAGEERSPLHLLTVAALC